MDIGRGRGGAPCRLCGGCGVRCCAHTIHHPHTTQSAEAPTLSLTPTHTSCRLPYTVNTALKRAYRRRESCDYHVRRETESEYRELSRLSRSDSVSRLSSLSRGRARRVRRDESRERRAASCAETRRPRRDARGATCHTTGRTRLPTLAIVARDGPDGRRPGRGSTGPADVRGRWSPSLPSPPVRGPTALECGDSGWRGESASTQQVDCNSSCRTAPRNEIFTLHRSLSAMLSAYSWASHMAPASWGHEVWAGGSGDFALIDAFSPPQPEPPRDGSPNSLHAGRTLPEYMRAASVQRVW